MATHPREGAAKGTRLDSWKEIATFFGRDARTVKRWESERALPVHRVPGGERGGVFAYVQELEVWLNDSRVKAVVGLSSSPFDGVPDLANQPLAEANDPILIVSAPDPSPVHLSSPRQAVVSHGAGRSSLLSIGLWTFAGILLAAAALTLLSYLLALHTPSAERASASETHSARAKSYVPDPEAADLYLKGRYYWNMRTGASLNQAVDYFTQSIVHDPQYAPAYAGLADCYLLMREYAAMPESEAFPRAVAAARKALELDPSSSEAHRSLAFALHYWDWNLPQAEREFRRALQLNPSDTEAHHWYATSLIASGRYSDALAQIDEARRLQPMSNSVLADRDLILLLAGRHEEAISALQQLEAAEPKFLSTHVYLAEAHLLTHDPRGYLDELAKVAAINKDDRVQAVVGLGRQALARGGESAMLLTIARQYGQLADRGEGSAYPAASYYALAGSHDQALSYLATSYTRHESDFLSARIDPRFERLRQDPQFQALASRVNTSSHRN
jgi:Tfp pilus assembly protein PilF